MDVSENDFKYFSVLKQEPGVFQALILVNTTAIKSHVILELVMTEL